MLPPHVSKSAARAERHGRTGRCHWGLRKVKERMKEGKKKKKKEEYEEEG